MVHVRYCRNGHKTLPYFFGNHLALPLGSRFLVIADRVAKINFVTSISTVRCLLEALPLVRIKNWTASYFWSKQCVYLPNQRLNQTASIAVNPESSRPLKRRQTFEPAELARVPMFGLEELRESVLAQMGSNDLSAHT
jgi:hypothetical protein